MEATSESTTDGQPPSKRMKPNTPSAPPAPPAFPEEILNGFESHIEKLKTTHETKKEATALRNVAMDTDVVESVDVIDTLGKRQPYDKFNGCVNLRTLRSLLKLIDDRGFERYASIRLNLCSFCNLVFYPTHSNSFTVHRSEHQMQFHSAFERCVSRVVYKGEWGKDRTAIMAHNGWERCSSEVMIS